ncbi:BSD domain-containing protein 1-like [Lolium rigidum]|uniref:BSD domain-containing protein 1-like n=1 Tax=Lolium rigidum TaxID=89674 RepID=UPI001F5D1123|nr:BSD domain-containing protein 1-like [Lolium rigidum]
MVPAVAAIQPNTAGSAPSPPAAADTGGWGFGGLLKTLTSQSENVLETYRRDLAEFSTGLRRETDAFREAAARAARDLPSYAHALDGLADIVAQGKDALAAAAASSASPPSADAESDPSSASGHLRYYSRFEAQLHALQSDPATFAADPDDAEDFAAWRREAGFSVDEQQEKIEALCYESDAVEGMLDRLVPDAVDAELFWARYFYRVHRLKQQEDARAKLVKRVIAQEEEEDLSWELDDEEPAPEEEIKQASINTQDERLFA